jgi:RNA polymerase sigma-70 factor (ECF subfamily)
MGSKMDAQVIELFVKGNKNAFENLYNEYYKLVFKVVYPRINDYDSTIDLCQEIFIEIYQSRETYNGGNIKYWILRIASNVTSDWIKKEIRRKEAETRYLKIDNSESNEDDLENDILEIAKNILDQTSYEIVVMHYLEKVKFKDIAKYYDFTISKVTSIASKAIKKIKQECKA